MQAFSVVVYYAWYVALKVHGGLYVRCFWISVYPTSVCFLSGMIHVLSPDLQFLRDVYYDEVMGP